MRRCLFIPVVLAAAAALPVAAEAHGGNAGLVHACVQKKSLVVRIVAPNARCRRGEKAVDWSLAGPAGPVGAAGSSGPQGPQGPQGPAGSIQAAPAGGDLTGTYPDPQIRPGAVAFSELAFDPFTESEYDDFRTFLFAADATPNEAADPIHWTNLQGVPASLVDGDDLGTLADGSVTTAKLADGAVTSLKVATDTLTSSDLASNSVTGLELAPSAVGTTNVINGTLTLADLAFAPALRDGSYVRIDVVTTAPPSADCDEASEAGRMLASGAGLWICTGLLGWRTIGFDP